MTEISRNRKVEDYLPEVRKLATRMASTLQIQASDGIEELYSVGCMALVECFKRYLELEDRHALNAIRKRVRGAMIDYVKGREHRMARFMVPHFSEGKEEIVSPILEDERNIETKLLQNHVVGLILKVMAQMKETELALIRAAVTGSKLVKAAPTLAASKRTKLKEKLFVELRRYVLTMTTKSELFHS